MHSGANTHNRLRQLKGLVSIDPWHEPSQKLGRVELHAYVSFDEARLGGEQGDEILFRLQLRRAEIKLLQSEPKSYEIDPALIWRGDGDRAGQLTSTQQALAESNDKRGLSGKIAPHQVGVSAEYGHSQTLHTQDGVELLSEISTKTIEVSFQRNDRDRPTWVLRPAIHAPRIEDTLVLNGRAWDEQRETLLSLKVNPKHASNEMLSSLRLCLTCRAEDLIFYGIESKEADGKFRPIAEDSPKKLVVQEFLRRALIAEELHAGDLNSPFSIVVLGEAVSEPRIEE